MTVCTIDLRVIVKLNGITLIVSFSMNITFLILAIEAMLHSPIDGRGHSPLSSTDKTENQGIASGADSMPTVVSAEIALH
jgi:hypothetical protein